MMWQELRPTERHMALTTWKKDVSTKVGGFVSSLSVNPLALELDI